MFLRFCIEQAFEPLGEHQVIVVKTGQELAPGVLQGEVACTLWAAGAVVSKSPHALITLCEILEEFGRRII